MVESDRLPRARVLFLCVHDSARSQMPEALIKRLAPDSFSEVDRDG
jgi:protein-tyrosine-phosphatase